MFKLTGFTNPNTSLPQYIDLKTHIESGAVEYAIDELKQSLWIAAKQGICKVTTITPVNDFRIYAMPQFYKVTMSSKT